MLALVRSGAARNPSNSSAETKSTRTRLASKFPRPLPPPVSYYAITRCEAPTASPSSAWVRPLLLRMRASRSPNASSRYLLAQSMFSWYPTPRTVIRCRGCRGSSSIFLRSSAIHQSTLRVVRFGGLPHAADSSSSRSTGIPRLPSRMRRIRHLLAGQRRTLGAAPHDQVFQVDLDLPQPDSRHVQLPHGSILLRTSHLALHAALIWAGEL